MRVVGVRTAPAAHGMHAPPRGAPHPAAAAADGAGTRGAAPASHAARSRPAPAPLSRRGRRRAPPPPPAAAAARGTLDSLEDEDSGFEDDDYEDPSLPPRAASPSSSPAAADFAAVDDADSRAFACALARAAADAKAEDVMVLHVAPLVYWTRYIVVATVFSRPQLGALLGRVEAEAGGERWGGRAPLNGAQPGASEWELLDYGDVCVNAMTPAQREYYDLEGFYAQAEEVAVEGVTGRGAGGGGGGGAGGGAPPIWEAGTRGEM